MHSLPTVDDTLLTIGTIAKQAGVTVRTLRYYEELGLIAPVCRTDSKYRLYSARVLRRIQAIISLQALGYSLEQTLVVLGPYSDTTAVPKVSKVTATRDTLTQIATCIDEKMAALKAMQTDIQQRLNTLDAACTPCLLINPQDHCDTHCTHRDVHMD